jgi:hypothetical protein
MPLYTVWRSGSWSEIAFAAVHCTGGDLLIALSALTVALMLVGTSAWPRGRPAPVIILTIAIGVSYTVLSEYLNIVMRAAWAYSELMPALSVGSLRIGISPLLQWLVVPFLALLAARGATRSNPPEAAANSGRSTAGATATSRVP